MGQFIQLRAEGHSFNTIAKKLKKAKGTLLEWNKELAEEIANCKALYLETLYEKYFLLKENHLQLFGDILLRLQNELSKRNFESLSTDKLLELLPKYHNFLKEEFIQLKFNSIQEIHQEKEDKKYLDSLSSILQSNNKKTSFDPFLNHE